LGWGGGGGGGKGKVLEAKVDMMVLMSSPDII
jgi:hypothetical protein